MPASKPIGALDETLNVGSYPHAAALVGALEFADPLGSVSYPYTGEMGLVGDPSMTFGGTNDEFVTYASPHERMFSCVDFDFTMSASPAAWSSSGGPFDYTGGSTGWTFEIIFESQSGSPFILYRMTSSGAPDNIVDFPGSANVDNGGASISHTTIGASSLHHVIVTYTHSTGTWEYWLDGVSQGTATGTLSDDTGWGFRTDAGTKYSCVRLYDRPLTSTEIADSVAEPYAVVGASLSSVVDFAGTSAAVSSVSGDLSVDRAVAGDAAGTGTTSGAATVARAVSGAAAATSATTGALSTALGLAGSAAATSSTTGNVTVARGLAGAAAAVSTAAGDLTAAGGATELFAGSATATSTTSGAATVARALAGGAVAASSTAGALGVERAVAGAAAAVSSGAGDLTATANVTFAGTAAASSATTGGIVVSRALAARAVGAAVGSGALVAARPLSGRAVSISAAVGDLTGELALDFDENEQISALGVALTRILATYDVIESLRTDGRVPTVVDGYKDIDSCMGLTKPVVCVFPAVQQPPPVTETVAGSYREDIEIVIIGYIDADDPMEARTGLGQLETLVTEVLLDDRRRDGWAFDTIKSGGTQTDEGLKADTVAGGAGSMFGALMTQFRVSSYPLEQGDEGNVAHADFYLASAGTVSIADASTVTEIAPAILTEGSASKWRPGAAGRARYTGSRTRTFKIEALVSLRQDLTSAADVDLFLMVGGTEVARTKITARMPDNETRAYSLAAMLDVAYNEEISVGIDAAETGTLNVETLQITAIPKLA